MSENKQIPEEEYPETEQIPEAGNSEKKEENDLPFSGERYSFRDLTGKDKPGNLLFSCLSLIAGALGAILSFFTVWALLPAALAVAFALIARRKNGYFDGLAIGGIALGVFGAVLALLLPLWKMIR